MVDIDRFRQRDSAKHATLAKLAQMYGSMCMAMLVGSLSLYNQRIGEYRDSNIPGVKSRQRKLKLKGAVAFRQFHIGNAEYFFFRLQPVANLVARNSPAPFEQLKRARRTLSSI